MAMSKASVLHPSSDQAFMEQTDLVWFSEADKKSSLLATIKSLYVSRTDYTFSALSISTDDGLPVSIGIGTGTQSLYDSSKKDVENQLAALVVKVNASSNTPHHDAQTELSRAKDSLLNWKRDRRASKWRAASSGLQTVLCTFSDFLQNFSGIAEILKAADQQYGGLAYGTLSLLLSVAVNKTKREEAMEDALEELAFALPRLETLQGLRPTESLRKLIATVFEHVILFCREAIQYYAVRLGGRILAALKPKEVRMPNLSRIRLALREIRDEIDVAALSELAEVRKDLVRVKGQLVQIQLTSLSIKETGENTNDWVRLSASHGDQVHMGELRKLLGMKRTQDGQNAHLSSSHCKTTLNRWLSDDSRKGRPLPRLSWELLEKQESVRQWWTLDGSALCLIAGLTANGTRDTLNWLSEASVLVAEHSLNLGEPSSMPLALLPVVKMVYFCQTTYTVTKRLRSTFSDIVRSMLYQLAEQHPTHMRAMHEGITDTTTSDKWKAEDPQIAFSTMADLLIRCMELFPPGTQMLLVIDRLDQCRWSDDPSSDANELPEAVKSFMRIVDDGRLAHLQVKVLLVMDGMSARPLSKNVPRDQKHHTAYWKTDWDQEELDNE